MPMYERTAARVVSVARAMGAESCTLYRAASGPDTAAIWGIHVNTTRPIHPFRIESATGWKRALRRWLREV